MKKHAFPILEFDSNPEAIIEPSDLIQPMDIPEHCVICFFAEVIKGLLETHNVKVVDHIITEVGQHPLYEMTYDGKRLMFFHPGVGAPLAVGLFEEVIARGCRKFIACGGCGVLDKEIAVGHLLLPAAAIRDEGTSYHYLPPSRDVQVSSHALAAIKTVLDRHGVDYLVTKTWTTDAFYRETVDKTAAYLKEGCLAVEMEAAAFFAVAQFRGVDFGQILYGGDAVISSGWDGRTWNSRAEIRRDLFWLAAESAFEL